MTFMDLPILFFRMFFLIFLLQNIGMQNPSQLHSGIHEGLVWDPRGDPRW